VLISCLIRHGLLPGTPGATETGPGNLAASLGINKAQGRSTTLMPVDWGWGVIDRNIPLRRNGFV